MIKKQPTPLGIIDFTNCLPIIYSFEQWKLDDFIIKKGHPVFINKLLKDNEILVAPVSSIEYLKNKEKYTLIEEACISSNGKSGSVILFSKEELNNLQGKTIGIPNNSATSITLLKILLKEHSITDINFEIHSYQDSLHNLLAKNYDAVLLIGDDALITSTNANQDFLQYDIGELWKEKTGLPTVFGTWVANSNWASTHESEFKQLKVLIHKAVEEGLGIYFNEIVIQASQKLGLDEKIIRDYLTSKMNYNLTSEHKTSLLLFEKLYKNLTS